MKDDLRRERLLDAATSRAAASAEGAALSVTAGSLMLGAMLSKVEAQQHQRGQEPAANRPDPHEAVPPQADATHDRTIESFSPAAEQNTSAGQALPSFVQATETALSGDIRGAARLDSAAGTFDRWESDSFVLTNEPAAAKFADAFNSTNLFAAGGHVTQTFYELSSSVKSLFEQITGTTTELTNTLYEMGDNISDAIADAASTLEASVDAMLDDLAPVEMAIGIADAVDVPNLQPMSWVDIDAVSSLNAGLDALPSALLGAYSEPKADGVLAQNFGATQAPPQESPPAPSIEDAGVEATSALGGPIGFIGVSYIDMIDPQDTAHHSLNSPMHGLI